MKKILLVASILALATAAWAGPPKHSNAGGVPACEEALSEASNAAASLQAANDSLESLLAATEAALDEARETADGRAKYLDWLQVCANSSKQLAVITTAEVVLQDDKTRALVETSSCLSANGTVATHVVVTDLDLAGGGGEICPCPPVGEGIYAFCPSESNCSCCDSIGTTPGGD